MSAATYSCRLDDKKLHTIPRLGRHGSELMSLLIRYKKQARSLPNFGFQATTAKGRKPSRAGVPDPGGKSSTGAQVRGGSFSFLSVRYGKQRSVRTVKVAATQVPGVRGTRQQLAPPLKFLLFYASLQATDLIAERASCPTK